MSIQLKGITWNHSRGYLPMVATSQRFSEIHSDIQISWEKRSLQQFADFPLQGLIDQYDLLVIDHPWAGYAAMHRVLVPLNEYVSADFLADQAANSVGASHISYQFAGSQTALAIDAATPVASYRADLLAEYELQLPTTYEQVLDLARMGRVIFPAIPVDSLMNFYMFCATLGEEPFLSSEYVISEATGILALDYLRELAALCPAQIYEWNPIAIYEQLSSLDHWVYCPFAYGYANYARVGYSHHIVNFTDTVSLGSHGLLQSTLGGTGIAISASCKQLDAALRYAQYAASPKVQRTLYYESGGQPGHRGAWVDSTVNLSSHDYFKRTLPTLDRAFLRPRYDGYLHFQDRAGEYVQQYMQDGGSARAVLERLNDIYRDSRLTIR